MRIRLFCLPFIILIVFAFSISAQEKPADDTAKDPTYTLKSSVIGASGAPGSSTQYSLNGTLGQSTPIGAGAGAAYMLVSGFWYQVTALMWAVDVALPEILTNTLYQPYPNPFNPMTTVEYMVAEESPVTITVFNLRGERLRTLVREGKPPGIYCVVWDGKDDTNQTVASGVYFCHLQIGGYESVKKMLMLK